MTEKLPAKMDVGDAEKPAQRTPDQRRAAFDAFFGILSPAKNSGSANGEDFLYDNQGMPGSAD